MTDETTADLIISARCVTRMTDHCKSCLALIGELADALEASEAARERAPAFALLNNIREAIDEVDAPDPPDDEMASMRPHEPALGSVVHAPGRIRELGRLLERERKGQEWIAKRALAMQAERDAALARAEKWEANATRAALQAEIEFLHCLKRAEERDAALAQVAVLRGALEKTVAGIFDFDERNAAAERARAALRETAGGEPQELLGVPKTLGEALRRVRELSGRTMGDVARALGCTVAAVSDWELGRAPLAEDEAATLAKAAVSAPIREKD